MCDQMHERCAKLLSQRSKSGSASKITAQELTSIGLLVAIFCDESGDKCGRTPTGLQLSLQSQTVMYVQAFHEENRTKLSAILEKVCMIPGQQFSSIGCLMNVAVRTRGKSLALTSAPFTPS